MLGSDRIPMMRHLGIATILLLSVLALTNPGYAALGNRIDPFVLGMPFSLFWNVLWIAVVVVALLAYDYLDNQDAS